MTLRDTRHRLEYALVVAVRGVVRRLPDGVGRALGTGIGLSFYLIDPGHRRLATRQLRAAFPGRTQAECRAIARATFVHFGRALVGVLRMSALSPDQIRARLDVEGDDRVRSALSAGKGVIIFTGHFGFWELQGVAHALVIEPMSVMARPLDNPYLHRLLEEMRCATGNRVIYRQGALRKVLRALQANECVGMLIDQHVHGTDGVKVNFFNRPAATTAALASLALRTGATLVPVFSFPTAAGRYRLVYEPPIDPPSADEPDPVRVLTQRCTNVLEMYVRRHPHLWLWMHRRWRDDDGDGDAQLTGMFPAAATDETESRG